MESLSWILLLCLFLISVIYLVIRGRHQKHPPGPPRVPLLGSLPFLNITKGILDWGLDPRVTQHRLASLALGPKVFNVINDLELSKELFEKEEFSGKSPEQTLINHRFWHNVPWGILFTQGAQWSSQRRFGLKTLKDFGFGKKSIEDSIHFEVDEMLETCFSSNEDILLGNDFNMPIINILWQIVANNRFSPADRRDVGLIKRVGRLFEIGSVHFMPLSIFYLLPKFISKHTPKAKQIDCLEGITKYLQETIKEHQDDHDPENPRDFIDVYLTEAKKGGNFNEQNLTASIHDFFVAGTETSSTTLKWILQYLTLHQQVQDRYIWIMFYVPDSFQVS